MTDTDIVLKGTRAEAEFTVAIGGNTLLEEEELKQITENAVKDEKGIEVENVMCGYYEEEGGSE